MAVLACSAAPKPEPLFNAVEGYNQNLRWQRFQDASSFLPVARRDHFLDRTDQLSKDLRIHHYQVVRLRYSDGGDRARVHVKYTWYRESEGVVRESHVVQNWSQEGNFWLLTDESMLRGPPMPGITDEEAPTAPPDPTQDLPETSPPQGP